MKSWATVLLTILMAVGLSYAQEIDSKDEGNSIRAECAFTPKYIWRGINYTKGFTIQPSISFAQNQFSVQFWSNLAAKDTSSTPVNEFNIYISYNYNLLGFVITPSLFYYSYPGQSSNSTAELNLALSYPIGKFTLGTSIAKDIMVVSHSFYGYHDIKFETQLSKALSLNLSTGFGWGNSKFNEYYIGLDKAAINFVLIGGSLSYAISEKFSIKPYFDNYIMIDQDIKNIYGNNNFNFGIAVGIEL